MSEATEKAPMTAAERMALARAAKAARAQKGNAETIEATEADIPEGWVKVRVMKLGDKRIATGELVEFGHSPEERFPTYARDERAYLPANIAESYEDRGWVEILR